jgi:hypothetical protein
MAVDNFDFEQNLARIAVDERDLRGTSELL